MSTGKWPDVGEKGVIVVGSGLAGLACALDLVEQGCDVTLLEAGHVLGGRTSSWVQDGMSVESGLHKFLGIYRELPSLLERVGIKLDEILTWIDELEFRIPEGPDALFTFSPYHRPLDTAVSLMRNTAFLPTAEKAKLSAMGLAGITRAAADPVGLDQLSIATYASEYGVSAEVVQRVLSTTTQAALFLPAERFSAYAAFGPVIGGLKTGLAMRIGAFNGGMTEVMINPIARAIEDRGGTIRTGKAVSSLAVEGERVTGVHAGGEDLKADHVVLAVSLTTAQGLLGRALPEHEWVAPLSKLPSLSAVTIQFELDQPVLESDRTHFSSTSVCCFAEQSRTTFQNVPGRISAILYPPEEFLNLSDNEVAERVYRETERMGINLRAHVKRYRIVSHPHDFYAMEPGTEVLRPPQKTPIAGLSLAGDYTKQRFSASMEGAVISGQLAAEAVLDELGGS